MSNLERPETADVLRRLSDEKEGWILNSEIFGWGKAAPYNEFRAKIGLPEETVQSIAEYRILMGVRTR